MEYILTNVKCIQAGAHPGETVKGAIIKLTTNNHIQNELSNVTEELAKIYHHICTANNITPSRVMLEHSKGELIVMTFFFRQNIMLVR